jgi:hypothetical protein
MNFVNTLLHGHRYVAMFYVIYKKSIAHCMIYRRVSEFMKEISNGLKNQSSYEKFEVSKVRVDRSLLGFRKAAEIFPINS